MHQLGYVQISYVPLVVDESTPSDVRLSATGTAAVGPLCWRSPQTQCFTDFLRPSFTRSASGPDRRTNTARLRRFLASRSRFPVRLLMAFSGLPHLPTSMRMLVTVRAACPSNVENQLVIIRLRVWWVKCPVCPGPRWSTAADPFRMAGSVNGCALWDGAIPAAYLLACPPDPRVPFVDFFRGFFF